MGEGQASRIRVIVVRTLLAIVALVVLVVGGIHLLPVRNLVLRSLLPLAGRANLIVKADGLDYNLFRLGGTVRNVTVAASQSPDAPFFTADRVTVIAPPGILRGLFSLTRVDIRGGRVRILRTASGSNLPTSSSTSTSEPAPLRLGHVTADLEVDIRDEVARYSVSFPRLTADLAPSGGQIASAGGRIGLRDQTITITSLAGGAAFDGRAVTLNGLNLVTDVATTRIDGPAVVISRRPTLDLRVSGDGNVARMTALATPSRVFDGQVSFAGSLAGPFTTPVAELRVRSARLDRDMLTLTDVDLTTRVNGQGADISQSTFIVSGGRVDVAAHLAFDGTANRVEGTWANVDLPRLINALVDRPPTVLPAGPTSGMVTSDGAGYDLTRWTTAADMNLGQAASVRDRLSMPGNSQLRIRGGAWRLDGRHRVGDVAPVGFALNGTIRLGGRVPVGGNVELATTEVTALTGVLTRVGLLEVPPTLLTGGSMTATGMLGGELTMPSLKGTAILDGVRGRDYLLGPARVGFDALPLAGDVQLEAHADSAEVAGQALTGIDASLRIRDSVVLLNSFAAAEAPVAGVAATGTVRGSGTYRLRNREYQLQADVSNWVWNGTAAVPARGIVDVSVMGTGTVDRPGGAAMATVREASYKDMALGTITALASLDGEQATVDLDVPQLNAKGRGQSSLRAPYNAAADVNVQALDLSQLQPLVSSNFTLRGMATADAHAEGDLSAWRDAKVTVNLAAAEALLGDLNVVLDGPAQIIYGSGTVGTVRLAAKAGGLQAEVRGSLPIDPSPSSAAAMTATLIGDVGDLVTAAMSTRLVDVPAISGMGPVAVLARVEGALRAPDISADIDLGPATLTAPDLPTFERLRLLAHVEDGRADVQDLFASVDGAEINATGSAPLAWISPALASPANANVVSAMGKLSAQLKNVTFDLIGRFATGSPVPDLRGSLDATVELTSATRELSGLTGEARIDRLDISAANIALTQTMPTRVVAGNGVARIASWDWTGGGTRFSLAGQVGLSDLEAEVQANGELDLRLLSPFLRSSGVATAGSLAPRLLITGKVTEPRIDGDITLTDAEIRLASPRVFVSGLNGTVGVNGNRLELPTMTGTINGGELTISGTAAFMQAAASTATMTAEIKGMALEYPEGLRTELDGSLTLDLGEESEGVERVPLLLGSLHIVNGAYREPVTIVGGALAALQSRVETVPRPVTVPGFADRLVLDITVVTDDDIVVDNNTATLSLDADVRVIGTLAEPALSGRAEVREGGRLLLGRNTYQVTSGALDFANPTRVDPDLNFQLTTRSGGVAIDVALTGTLSAPMLALSTADGDFAQSDLTSLLLTGRTLDQLGSADAAVVGDVLVGNLSGEVGQVLGLAGRVVGIDTVRLGGVDNSILQSDPAAIATETDPTSRLTFTKALGSNLDVTFSQSLRDGDQQTWVVEYRPTRRLIARLVSDDDDLRSYEFRHDVQVGSNPMGIAAARPKRIPARVSDVTIEGALPGHDVRGMLALESGKTFQFDTLQNDRERIEEFYRTQGYLTARVGARQKPSGDTVAVTFVIQPGPLTRIAVTGTPLPRGLVDEVGVVWADSIAGPLLIDEVRTLVEDRLAEQGYQRAKVDVTLSDEAGVQVLTIATDRGQRTTQILVVLDGIDEELSDELSDKLALEKVVPAAPRNPQVISNSLEAGLRERGYMQPRVAVDSPVYDGEMAVVNVHVQAGDQVLLGPVTVTGATLPIERVREALDLTEGLSYLQAAVDNAETRLTSFYRQEGYPMATVMLETVPRPADGVIAVTVTVQEGPRQFVSAVRVEGLRKIDEDVAQRAMDLEPGQPARAEDLLRARTRLYATGLFRRVDVASMPEPEDTSRPGQLPVSLVATVEEWPMVRFRYGVQVAEEKPDDESRRELVPGFSADATRKTLFGRAITIGGAAVVQRSDRRARIFASAPTFLTLPLHSQIVMQKEREVLPADFISDKTTLSFEQRAKLLTHLGVGYAYRYSREHSFLGTENPLLPPVDVYVSGGRVTGTVAWDSRNEPSAPVRGSLVSGSIEVAPVALGSDVGFIRYFAQARHFQQLRRTGKTVFASAFQYGLVIAASDEVVPRDDLFFTGGGTSIRGVPDDEAAGSGPFGPIGGRVLILFNQEARVPIWRWVEGVGFLDAGNVFPFPGDASLSGLTTSVGIGLRVVTPFALFRLDYGRIVGSEDREVGRSRLIFGIGHAF